jgi:phage repressor protein C with HTH and peptisase S24 domain
LGTVLSNTLGAFTFGASRNHPLPVTDIYETRRARLRELIDLQYAGKQSALAAVIERQAGYVSRCLNGQKRIGEDFARHVERASRRPYGWLDSTGPAADARVLPERLILSGHVDGADLQNKAWQPDPLRLRLPDARPISVAGIAQLGDGVMFVELESLPRGEAGSVWFTSDDTSAYAVRCEGDSMAPRIQHGEFAVLEPSRDVAPGDEVLVRGGDGRVMIKRLRYVRDGRVHLDSLNAVDHPPVILNRDEIAAMHYVAAIVKPTYFRAG